MKKSFSVLCLVVSLLLSGCSAMLEREYSYTTPHNTAPTAAEGDPSILRAENYQELVNALIYFITQGAQTGSIRLYGEWEDIESDLDAACLEVVQEDPLGAYAVEYIKYSTTSVVTYYEADIHITYRRTREQMASIVSATGTSAIRNELASALASFATEQVLRISYFDENEDYIRTLCLEAYCANPATALDMPEVEVFIYPDSGQQRIVEILLSYHLDLQELERRHTLLLQAVDRISVPLMGPILDDQTILDAAQAILLAGGFNPNLGSTAYHALLEGGADYQGLSLALALVCQQLGIDCRVVSGNLNGTPHFWNVVATQDGWRHFNIMDLDRSEVPFYLDDQMKESGYTWDSGAVPRCR
ncbi:MAG: transglutaminase domain-containing protein [Lawsonibacter sp.]|jgi:hypothetical protein